jgi:hypothetical protein
MPYSRPNLKTASNFCCKIVTLVADPVLWLVKFSKPLDIFRIQGTKFYRSPVSTAFFRIRPD